MQKAHPFTEDRARAKYESKREERIKAISGQKQKLGRL